MKFDFDKCMEKKRELDSLNNRLDELQYKMRDLANVGNSIINEGNSDPSFKNWIKEGERIGKVLHAEYETTEMEINSLKFSGAEVHHLIKAARADERISRSLQKRYPEDK